MCLKRLKKFLSELADIFHGYIYLCNAKWTNIHTVYCPVKWFIKTTSCNVNTDNRITVVWSLQRLKQYFCHKPGSWNWKLIFHNKCFLFCLNVIVTFLIMQLHWETLSNLSPIFHYRTVATLHWLAGLIKVSEDQPMVNTFQLSAQWSPAPHTAAQDRRNTPHTKIIEESNAKPVFQQWGEFGLTNPWVV